jgi:hypothetical protein
MSRSSLAAAASIDCFTFEACFVAFQKVS